MPFPGDSNSPEARYRRDLRARKRAARTSADRDKNAGLDVPDVPNGRPGYSPGLIHHSKPIVPPSEPAVPTALKPEPKKPERSGILMY